MSIQITGLRDIVDQYDLFLLDQFGVLHDGRNPYPYAIDTLEQLAALEKSVFIISNSGKRSAVNVERMNKIGFDPSLYKNFVTSGDVAHSYLQKTLNNKGTKKCFLVSRDQDTSAIEGLELELTNDPTIADLIIISSSEGDQFDELHYVNLLSESAAKNTLCLCTNPDKKMLTADGIRFGAGRIAEIYEEQGGEVIWIGKPHQSIYQHVLSIAGTHDKRRTLCVGDSIEHDIVGGQVSELRTLLVRTGIASSVSLDDLTQQFAQYGAKPEYIADALQM